jgi:hypothetical protein
MEEHQFGHSIMVVISVETKLTFTNQSKKQTKTRNVGNQSIYCHMRTIYYCTNIMTMLSKPVSSRVIVQTLRIKCTDLLINFNVESLILDTVFFADDQVSVE